MPVYLLRHAYSEWQEQYDITHVDPGIYDARLSTHGWLQVQEAASGIRALGIDLIVTSPLTRAIETAVGLFEGVAMPPLLVHPLLTERLGDSCDIGRLPRVLAAEFPMADFSHLTETWWYVGELDGRGIPVEPWPLVEARAAAFAQWLESRVEQSILVVSHSGLLLNLGGTEIGNCEFREWTALPPPRSG